MTSRHIEIPDDLLAAIDYCYEQGWTDGLPVIPPELSRVEAMCAMEGRPQIEPPAIYTHLRASDARPS